VTALRLYWECRVSKGDKENRQWEMSAFPCPACSLVMRLVGKERPERESKGYLLTFQCDCGSNLLDTKRPVRPTQRAASFAGRPSLRIWMD